MGSFPPPGRSAEHIPSRAETGAGLSRSAAKQSDLNSGREQPVPPGSSVFRSERPVRRAPDHRHADDRSDGEPECEPEAVDVSERVGLTLDHAGQRAEAARGGGALAVRRENGIELGQQTREIRIAARDMQPEQVRVYLLADA